VLDTVAFAFKETYYLHINICIICISK